MDGPWLPRGLSRRNPVIHQELPVLGSALTRPRRSPSGPPQPLRSALLLRLNFPELGLACPAVGSMPGPAAPLPASVAFAPDSQGVAGVQPALPLQGHGDPATRGMEALSLLGACRTPRHHTKGQASSRHASPGPPATPTDREPKTPRVSVSCENRCLRAVCPSAWNPGPALVWRSDSTGSCSLSSCVAGHGSPLAASRRILGTTF